MQGVGSGPGLHHVVEGVIRGGFTVVRLLFLEGQGDLLPARWQRCVDHWFHDFVQGGGNLQMADVQHIGQLANIQELPRTRELEGCKRRLYDRERPW